MILINKRIRRTALMVSATILLVGTVFWIFKGINYGIDFAGGIQILFKFSDALSVKEIAQIREHLNKVNLGGNIQYIEARGHDKPGVLIKTKGTALAEKTANAIINYRKRVKEIKDLDELRNIPGMNNEEIRNDVRRVFFINIAPSGEVQKTPTDSGIAVAATDTSSETATATVAAVPADTSVADKSAVQFGLVDINRTTKKELIETLDTMFNQHLAKRVEEMLKGLYAKHYEIADKTDVNNVKDINTLSREMKKAFAKSQILRIVGYKQKNGEFPNLDAIKSVPGIEDYSFEELSNVLTAADDTSSKKININKIQQDCADTLAERINRNRQTELQGMAKIIIEERDRRGGLFKNINEVTSLRTVKLVPEVVNVLNNYFYAEKFILGSVDVVGPTIGKDLRNAALISIIISMVIILLYITVRFEYRFAIGGVVAVFHDVYLVAMIMIILGREFDYKVIAALLTLAGYSINDTIVVFDRVRENLKLMRRETLEGIFNASIIQTLPRTIMVSLTVFLAVLALFIWGGEAIHDFALAMLFGVVTGTYSSVYIASAAVLEIRDFQARKKPQGQTTPKPTIN